MIRSFRDKETESLFARKPSRRLPFDVQRTAYRKLLLLHAATCLEDLRLPPENWLEALAGKRKGQYSVRVNDQWRLCFIWRDGNAHEVEIVDYH